MTRQRNRTKKGEIAQTFSPTTPNHKYGLLPVNNITYGNPNAEQAILVEKVGNFDSIANHFMDKPYPDNDGKYAQSELTKISEQMKNLEHTKVIEMCFKFDEDLSGMCQDIAKQCGVANPKEFVNSVFSDIDSIILKLKFFYNRIRPFQLANIYQYPLNAMPTISAQSPSYPSGHTIQSKVIADILSFKYPEHSSTLEKFAGKCSKSRVILGVHFPSDEVFGLQVATAIIKDDNFRKRYLVHQTIEDSGARNQHQQSQQQQQQQSQMNSQEIFGGMPEQPAKTHQHLDESQVFGGLPTKPPNQ